VNFATFEYFLFFAFVFVVYWRLSRPYQNALLCLASYTFYAFWDWRFLSLIIISTLVDYVAGRRIFVARTRRARKTWFALSLIVNLGILGYFKYYGFFLDSLTELAGTLGIYMPRSTMQIILPVGISFYTFQTMSYSLDIYREKLRPTDRLIDFAAFVAFFPQLVAGPIVRAREFLYQLEKDREFSVGDLEVGLRRFISGLFKKLFIADILGVYLVDPVFADPARYHAGMLWFAMLGYTVQIYADFSGYSSMAIGSARMLGFVIPENFLFPYLARNISEFWRRWHMTMSRFFRDFVYIPLGGNRRGQKRAIFNLAVTTLVSGLWHGAAWTFVVYGGLHGIFLSINQLWRRRAERSRGREMTRRIGIWSWTQMPSWLLTFLCINLARILFRARDFSTAWEYFLGLFRWSGGETFAIPVLVYASILACIVDHLAGWLMEQEPGVIRRVPTAVQAAGYVAMILILFHGRPAHVDPFIYFQF